MFDLRAEPYVLTLPAIEKNRYYSVQMIDQYTFNFDYLGTRTTGNGGGKFLIAGPNWHGSKPAGISRVVQSDTQLALALIRTQLFNAADIGNVHRVQAGYKIQPLSAYLGTEARAAAPKISWPLPMSAAEPKEFSLKNWFMEQLMPPERTSPAFFDRLAFVLQFCPVAPVDAETRKRFEQIGIFSGSFKRPGNVSDKDLTDGMAAGRAQIDAARAATKTSVDLFGTPTQMAGKYLNRAVAAQLGILGNTAAEAIYLTYEKGADGKPLSGTKKYVLRFAPGKLPPVKAFWSLTMYDFPQQLLVANPLNRYLINSTMLPQLKRDKDGGITLYLQKDSPGKDRESNWLPTPPAGFFMVLRCYYPDQPVIDGTWKQPAATPV